jgi:hypothetical protein
MNQLYTKKFGSSIRTGKAVLLSQKKNPPLRAFFLRPVHTMTVAKEAEGQR